MVQTFARRVARWSGSAGAFVPRPRWTRRWSASTSPRRRRSRCPTTEHYRAVVHAAFGQRRKTLRNALRARLREDAVDAALAATAIDGVRRGETLTIAEFAALARALPAAVTQTGIVVEDREELGCLSCPRSSRSAAACCAGACAGSRRAGALERPAAAAGPRPVSRWLRWSRDPRCAHHRRAPPRQVPAARLDGRTGVLVHLGMSGNLLTARRAEAVGAAHPRASSSWRTAATALHRSAALRPGRRLSSAVASASTRRWRCSGPIPSPNRCRPITSRPRRRTPHAGQAFCSISRCSPGSATSTRRRRCGWRASRRRDRRPADSATAPGALAATDVLSIAIDNGGTTLRDFVGADGSRATTASICWSTAAPGSRARAVGRRSVGGASGTCDLLLSNVSASVGVYAIVRKLARSSRRWPSCGLPHRRALR
jgi:hypothetical protein